MARANFERAKELYPSCGMGADEWIDFFRTAEGHAAFGKILYDIYDEVKAQEEKAAGVHKMGRRPARDAVSLDEVFGLIFPNEWNNDPFPVVLRRLIGDRSQRQFAYRVPCSQPHLMRLLSGEREPTMEMLEQIAVAAKVDPWYFVEWRAMFIGQLVTAVLLKQPHMSITAMKALRTTRRRVEESA